MNWGPEPRETTVRDTVQPRLAVSAASAVRWLTVAAFVTLIATGCTIPPQAVPGPDSVLLPPIAEPGARTSPVPIPAEFRLPPGKGPFPAVIVLHGCGGLGASQVIWARRLNGWGYAAVIPDSMTPRDVKRVCEPDQQGLVTPRDRVSDVGSAIAWLKSRPEIDPDRIAVLGLSHGGATAVIATERRYSDLGLRAAVDYYGPCIGPTEHGTVPVLVLVGQRDDWGHPAQRCEAYATALQPGQVFELYVYPGAYHAFDNPEMPRSESNAHIMEYNPAAAADSFTRVQAFLDRWLRH